MKKWRHHLLNAGFISLFATRARKTDLKNSQVWLNGWVFVSELKGCGFESSCSHLKYLSRSELMILAKIKEESLSQIENPVILGLKNSKPVWRYKQYMQNKFSQSGRYRQIASCCILLHSRKYSLKAYKLILHFYWEYALFTLNKFAITNGFTVCSYCITAAEIAECVQTYWTESHKICKACALINHGLP